jgi:hypothetical protein
MHRSNGKTPRRRCRFPLLSILFLSFRCVTSFVAERTFCTRARRTMTTGNAKFDRALTWVSTKFMVADSGATDEEHASLGLALSGLSNGGFCKQVMFSYEDFHGANGVLSLVGCDVDRIAFMFCNFSDAAFSSLTRLIQNAANIRHLHLHDSLPRGSVRKLVDAFRHTAIRRIELCIQNVGVDDDGTNVLIDAVFALGRNRRVEQFSIDVRVPAFHAQRCRRMIDALRWNAWATDVKLQFKVYGFYNEDIVSWTRPITELIEANRAVARIINAQTPPLGDGYGTDSGDWEALPNEMVCAVAERVWPSSAALEMAYVCQRLRDCVLSDYVVRLRMGPDDADGYTGFGDWRLLYRAAWMEQQQQE